MAQKKKKTKGARKRARLQKQADAARRQQRAVARAKHVGAERRREAELPISAGGRAFGQWVKASGDLKIWRERYALYLRTAHWKALRVRVLSMAQDVCEFCTRAKATEVHHFSYKRLGYEHLDDLCATCRDCHENWHSTTDDTVKTAAQANVIRRRATTPSAPVAEATVARGDPGIKTTSTQPKRTSVELDRLTRIIQTLADENNRLRALLVQHGIAA